MTSVLQLLTLPANSNGFTVLPDLIADIQPRRDSAADSFSAAPRANQPVKIRVVGSSHRTKGPKIDKLQQCIRLILTRDHVGLPAPYEAVYSDCFSAVCVMNKGEDRYEVLKQELGVSVSRLSAELLSETEVHDFNSAGKWIESFVAACQWFETQVALLQSLLTYLDQVYVRRTQVPTIHRLAFSIFARTIFENPKLMDILRNSVLTLIQAERALGRIVSDKTKNLLPALISHLYTHNQYSVFEEYYCDMTRQFYETDSREHVEKFKDNAKLYFDHVQSRIEKEVVRSRELLPVGSWGIIRDATVKALLKGRMQWIARETLGDYLDSKDFKKLESMNRLFSDAEGSKDICDAFKNHVLKSVQTIVQDQAADDTMVQRLLDCHALARSTIDACFLREPVYVPETQSQASSKAGSTSMVPAKLPKQEFVYALSDAFAMGFKVRRNKPAEMIARHLDKLMRKGQGAMSDVAFNALLERALRLYRFTEDKDVFRKFYLRALSKRLLLEKSASHDFEAAVLKKLKEEYDPEFSMGGEMFSDLDLSRDMMAEYHSKFPYDSEKQKLQVMVLKESAWPYSQEDATLILPPTMQQERNAFEQYYKDKHSGRKLSWQCGVATATLMGHFKAGVKELSVSLYQAVILLLFNGASELSFSEIKEETKLEDVLLRITLQSLACGKKRVLLKLPMGRDINDGDAFRFNDGFTDPRPKVHINSIQAKISEGESKQTQTAIDGERGAQLDAAIVRIMKSKKEMVYEKLVNAVIDAVKNHFTPDVKTIKVRIDKMIEQEYVRRDDDKPQMLFYVA
ncbi:Cullin-4B [Mycena pura]|uniref:Cullin-4B n=1 Tax=Mycena pura TaxID=153505 RepID=A0AAD7E371_9AGAR|nr:Cullin-4B [Mycena pura]